MSDNSAVYQVDPSHTEVGFSVRHMVVANVKGRFNEVEGAFTFDPSNPAAFTANATVKAASISTRNDQRDGHLKSPDFFDVEKFPEITFAATRVEEKGGDLVLHGNLTMRDVTREIAMPIETSGPITDPYGKQRAGFEGSVKVNRQDWGIAFNGKLASGDLVVGDEVKITVSVEGIKED